MAAPAIASTYAATADSPINPKPGVRVHFWRLARSTAFAVIASALLVVLIGTLWRRIPDTSLTIRVELTTAAPGTGLLFINAEVGKPPLVTEVQKGRQTLSFSEIRGPIHSIRVDPISVA